MSFSKDIYQIRSGQRARDLIYAAVAAVVVFAVILAVGQTVHTAVAGEHQAPVAVAQKGDRLTTAVPMTCEQESWGNWSSACVAQISGHETLRQVRFETIETRPEGQNISVLERVAAQS